MNPLPRFLALALFTVLAALVVVLAAPLWQRLQPDAPHEHSGNQVISPAATGAAANSSVSPTSGVAPLRMLALTQRIALMLAIVSVVLVITLIGTLAFGARAGESRAPLVTARTEFRALARLAESSVAQGAELSRERDVRRRAEQDAELNQQLLTQSLEEKIRLGRDLHDGIIQSLYAVGLTIEAVRTLVKSDPAEADRRLEQTRAALNDTIREVRDYIGGLAPERLRRAGFAFALEKLVAELCAARGTQFDIKIEPEAASVLTPEQTAEALQIAREAVSNALRHGGASRLTLRLHAAGGTIHLLIQDDGVGFDAARIRPAGHGLSNMRARAARIGASIEVTSQPGQGARVTATLPLIQSAVV